MRSFLSPDSPRPEPLEFIKVSGNCWPDDYEDEDGLWRHPHPIDADGPIWLYIKMTELPSDCRGPFNHNWEASLIAVSPFYATDNAIRCCLESCGDYLEDVWKELDRDHRILALCEAMISYGVKLNVIDKTSTRAKGPFKGCASEATVAMTFWGFVADRQANACGDTGWEFLAGTYGFSDPKPREEKAFHTKVIRWLNRTYPERKTYHKRKED